MSAFRRLGVVLAVAVLLISGCPADLDVQNYFNVVATPIGKPANRPATIIDVAQAGDQLWVWSVRDGRDELHHSTDGGQKWQALAPPPMGGITTDSYSAVDTTSQIVVLRGNLVIFRSHALTSGAGASQSPASQKVAISKDGGKSWVAPTLPTAAGTSPLVFGADLVDNKLFLLGASQSTSLPRRKATPAVLDGGYQAKVWVQGGAGGFTSIGDATLKMPHASIASRLLRVGGRLLVLGETGNGICCVVLASNFSWQSADGGATWSQVVALGGGLIDEVQIVGERLLISKRFDLDRALEPGADRWVKYDGFPPWGNRAVEVGDGTVVATWNEDEACDCSFSYATRYRRGAPFPSGYRGEATRLNLPCFDTSIRGYTAVEPLVDLGPSIAAFATCDDSGGYVGNLVWTMDDGITWHTDRLTIDGQALPAGTAEALSLDRAIVLIQLLDGQPTAVRITDR